MAKRAVSYALIDAFTDTPFKGNPAAVCLLEPAEDGVVDEEWMQKVAAEFNVTVTCFVSRAFAGDGQSNGVPYPRFNIRWFTPVAEVELCGHGTLAAAHFLITSGMVKIDVIEFVNKSRLLTAKKDPGFKHLGTSDYLQTKTREKLSIELDFPVIPIEEYGVAVPSIPETLNGASIINVHKSGVLGDLIVELASGKELVDIRPNFDELRKCPGRGVIVTAPAPAESEFDFFTRFFCPKKGLNEDPVCGSAHCALTPYWSKKLGKHNLSAYMASARGGRLDLQLEEETQRVRIKGEAVTVMIGTLLV